MITSYNKKKLNIGNNREIDITKIFKFVEVISIKLPVGINPPEDIVVKARLTASRSLILINAYKKITKIVEKK